MNQLNEMEAREFIQMNLEQKGYNLPDRVIDLVLALEFQYFIKIGRIEGDLK